MVLLPSSTRNIEKINLDDKILGYIQSMVMKATFEFLVNNTITYDP